MYNEMSVTLISVSHDTVVSNKHEEQTRHYYVNFQHMGPSSLRKAQRMNVHFSLHSPYFALCPVKGKRIFFPLAAVSKDPSNCIHGHDCEQHKYCELGNWSGEFHLFATGEEFSNRDWIISKVPIM